MGCPDVDEEESSWDFGDFFSLSLFFSALRFLFFVCPDGLPKYQG